MGLFVCLSVGAGSLQGPVHDVSPPQGWCLHTGDRSLHFETGQAAMGKQESHQRHGAEKARKTFAGQEERSRRIYLGGIGNSNFPLKGKLMDLSL